MEKTIFKNFKRYHFKEGYRNPDLEKKFHTYIDKYEIKPRDFNIFEEAWYSGLEFSLKRKILGEHVFKETFFIIFSRKEAYLLTPKKLAGLIEIQKTKRLHYYKISLPLARAELSYFAVPRAIITGTTEVARGLSEVLITTGVDLEEGWSAVFLPAYGLYRKLFPHYTLSGLFLYDEFGYNLSFVHEAAHIFYNLNNSQRIRFHKQIKKHGLIFEDFGWFEMPLNHKYIGELFSYLVEYSFCAFAKGKEAADEFLKIGDNQVKFFKERIEREPYSQKSLIFKTAPYPQALSAHIFARLFAPVVLKHYGEDWPTQLLRTLTEDTKSTLVV